MRLPAIISAPVSGFLKQGATIIADRFLARDPRAAQTAILVELINRAATTRFGKINRFDLLTDLPADKLYDGYRKLVPIRTYRDFWDDYFSRGFCEKNGKRSFFIADETWPGLVPLFCETSGTTAPTKYIPFTPALFAANRKAAMELTACYLAGNRKSRLLQGKLLYMAGNTTLSDLGHGVRSGDMSAITLVNAPWYLRPLVSPSPEVSSLPWAEKLESLADILLTDSSIRGISGVPPWILLLLKRCVERGGKPLSTLLPNLELIIHGGTSLKPYRHEFDTLFNEAAPNFIEVLPSSEAFMGFQLPGESTMRLTPYYGAFFEFVPFDKLDENGTPPPYTKAISLAEVVAGEKYAIILTTCGGLWRYHIGDTIRFLDTETFHFEFTGRDKFLDRFEEKVTQGEVEEAVARLNRLTGINVCEFMVGPDIPGRHHQWVLAVAELTQQNEGDLASMLDRSLMEMNADYATFRQQGRIAEPTVAVVAKDAIYDWSRDIRHKVGGQSKIPHIDPTVAGEMISSLLTFTRH